ncbi:MAG: sugar phosphate isomerase/epimerase [Verrucomicrobiales bacterium]|nr:sugar phosphate isomerase/epimerase [Verrucomicrobiales bacterium]
MNFAKPESTKNRRHFLIQSGTALIGSASFTSCKDEGDGGDGDGKSDYPISLAQWSLHRALKGGTLDNLDWPEYTKTNFAIEALEWVNQFFFVENDKLGYQPKDQAYLTEMKKRVDDQGMKSLLIMCDRVGQLGNPDAAKRTAAVEGHYAWLEAAKFLGCQSLRVNAASDAKLSPEEQADLCVDGLGRLSEKAEEFGLNVIVENHGGYSSHGAWLANVLDTVGRDNCGALPDYGNFYLVKNRGNAEQYEKQKAIYEGDGSLTESEKGLEYDRYKGVRDLMPHAKGVSAKAHDFDENGNETNTDFAKMMKIVKDSGYEGHMGVEFEGSDVSEDEGIKLTKALLEKVIAEV